MKIGIISDTHGDMHSARQVLSKMGKIDKVIHLGDYYEDGLRLKEIFNGEMWIVKGNCDGSAKGQEEMVIEIENKKIFLTHGHRYDVKLGLERLYFRALELGCQVALYGHTHISINISKPDLLILNPGSPSLPRGGSKASFGLIEIERGRLYGNIVLL